MVAICLFDDDDECGYVKCPECGTINDLTTDDLYNTEHTKWQCNDCNIWHNVQ